MTHLGAPLVELKELFSARVQVTLLRIAVCGAACGHLGSIDHFWHVGLRGPGMAGPWRGLQPASPSHLTSSSVFIYLSSSPGLAWPGPPWPALAERR